MIPCTIKDISFLSAFIGHNFTVIIESYLDFNYIQCLVVVTEITGEVYNKIESSPVMLESLEMLDIITKEVKNILWRDYGINLITNEFNRAGEATNL